MQSGTVILCVATVMSGLFTGLASQNQPAKKITEGEIKTFINSRAGVEVCETLDQIRPR